MTAFSTWVFVTGVVTAGVLAGFVEAQAETMRRLRYSSQTKRSRIPEVMIKLDA
jgi:hypothetical protein